MRFLTEHEMYRIEQFARRTKLAEMLSFFEGLPRRFTVPRSILLGSNNNSEIRVQGFTSRAAVIESIRNLDEPFNPSLALTTTLMAKERETRIGTMQPIYRALSQGFAKTCLANALGGCCGKIIRAHSLQKALLLPHARNGHVYEFDPFCVGDNGFRPTRIGVNEATTFTGFCEHHDASLFAPIEVQEFTAQPQQLFKYHYRAVAQAYYNRAYKFKILEQALIENAPKVGAADARRFAEDIQINRFEVQELLKHKDLCEQNLVKENWSEVEGSCWKGMCAPDIFAADFFGPRKDFNGKILQDCKSLAPLQWMSLTITATNNCALVLLCAERGSQIMRSCAESLRRHPNNLQTMAIVNFIVCQLENFIMLPKWWEPLPDDAKRLIVNAYTSRYFPRKIPNVCDWKLSEMSVSAK
jgi:hypothetical protein